jgi:hypothetical protein
MNQNAIKAKLIKFLKYQYSLRENEFINLLKLKHSEHSEYNNAIKWIKNTVKSICLPNNLLDEIKYDPITPQNFVFAALNNAPDIFKHNNDSSIPLLKQLFETIIEVEQLIRSLELGYCHGFALIFAAKRLFGHESLLEWYEMRNELLDWNETQISLKNEVYFKSRKVTLERLAEEMLNEIIFHQVESSNFIIKDMKQYKFLEPDIGAFEILKNYKLYSIEKVCNFAGSFNTEQLDLLLTEESLTNTMCLLGGLLHETCVYYDKSQDKPWCFYDPNYLNLLDDLEDMKYIDIQSFKTKSELIDRLIKDLGRQLSIRFAIMGEKNKKYENNNLPAIFTLDYDELLPLQTSPGDLLNINNLSLLLKYSPKNFYKILNHWIKNENNFIELFMKKIKDYSKREWEKLTEILNTSKENLNSFIDALDEVSSNKHKRNGWHALCINCDAKMLSSIFQFLCETKKGTEKCYKGILMPDANGTSGLHQIAKNNPDCLPDILLIILNEDNCKNIMDELVKLTINKNFSPVKCISILLNKTEISNNVKKIIFESCKNQAKNEEVVNTPKPKHFYIYNKQNNKIKQKILFFENKVKKVKLDNFSSLVEKYETLLSLNL